jgi:hypothetical protein
MIQSGGALVNGVPTGIVAVYDATVTGLLAPTVTWKTAIRHPTPIRRHRSRSGAVRGRSPTGDHRGPLGGGATDVRTAHTAVDAVSADNAIYVEIGIHPGICREALRVPAPAALRS